MDKLTRVFELERETKGAVRYAELNADGTVASADEYAIGSIYIRKSKLNGETPERFTMTIDFEG